MSRLARGAGLGLVIASLLLASTAGGEVLVVHVEQLRTGTGTTIRNAHVVIEDGRIRALGVADEVAIPAGARVLSGWVATPGFIDAHTSAGLSGLRNVPAVLDHELIYRWPSYAEGTDVKEEFVVTIRTNALGLRDRDYAATKRQHVLRRLLVLGDSMTFAEGVEAEETYPKFLEQALGDRYEVINAAIRGYGTDQPGRMAAR